MQEFGAARLPFEFIRRFRNEISGHARINLLLPSIQALRAGFQRHETLIGAAATVLPAIRENYRCRVPLDDYSPQNAIVRLYPSDDVRKRGRVDDHRVSLSQQL